MFSLIELFKDCIRERYSELIDDAHTKRLLDHFEELSPDLVNALIPKMMSLTQVTTVLKQLASEGLPITHISVILQAISEAVPETSKFRQK